MDVQRGRWTAEIDGDFVVFLIGAAVYDPVAAPDATRLLMTMGQMLEELVADPSKGLLGFTTHGEGVKSVIVAMDAETVTTGRPVWRATRSAVRCFVPVSAVSISARGMR